MTERCCFFDPFHEAPDVTQVRNCLRKLLNHHHARALGHRPTAEISWLLCGGRPNSALQSLRFTPSPSWPRGFYDLGVALPLSIVVLSELPETSDTLALRLMGAGLTLRRALVDLHEMPSSTLLDALVRRVIEFQHDRSAGGVWSPQDEDELMKSLPFVEELERRCRTEGRSEGRTEGRSEGRTEGTHLALVRYVERALGRATTDRERDALRERLIHRGESALDEAFALAPAALEGWLARDPN